MGDEKLQAQLQEQLSVATSPSVQASADPTARSSDARICFPFLNHGRCDREATCRFRHLAPDHPDAVADRMRTGSYDKIPAHANPLVEQNQHTAPGELRICYAYLNCGTCDRSQCSFRHLLAGHPDAIADRVRNGQLEKIPHYARAALARGGGPYDHPSLCAQPPMGSWHGAPADASNTGGIAGAGRPLPPHGGGPMVPAPLQGQAMGGSHYASGWGPLHLQMAQQGSLLQNHQSQPHQGQMQGHSGSYHHQPFQCQFAPAQYGGYGSGGYGSSASLGPAEQRLCFPFMNTGRCERAEACRFRHLSPDHPDAVTDRARTGRGAAGSGGSSGFDLSGAMSLMSVGTDAYPAYLGYG